MTRAPITRGTTHYSKPAFSIAQQCGKLRARGLVCEPAVLAATLEQVHYYRLSGYVWWFQDEHDVIRAGTSLDDVMRLYAFDQRLRELLLSAIAPIEVWLRTRLVHETAEEWGPFGYLNAANMRSAAVLARDMRKLQERLEDPSESFLIHFLEKYSDPFPPIWMAAELMSIGLLSKWYDNIGPDSMRKRIAAPSGLQPYPFASYLRTLTVVRNVCAHHGRLWNRRYATKIALPRTGDGNLMYALEGVDASRLYPILVITAYLLKKFEPDNPARFALRDHILTADADWLGEMVIPENFETDDIWI